MSAAVDKGYLARRAARSAAGICISCGREPRKETSSRCEGCSAKHNKYQRGYQRKHNINNKKYRALYLHADAEGMTFQEIGDAMGISRTRAEQIYYRAMSKMHKECVRRGIDPSMIIERAFSMLATAEKWAGE